jgi:hypothetical protein
LRAYTLGIDVPAHGDCPCCSSGIHTERLKNSAQRLQTELPKFENIVPLFPSNTPLPVLGQKGGCSSGGCSSCGTHQG